MRGRDGERRRRWQTLRENRQHGIYLLPSFLTVGNIFCGFLSMVLTFDGRYTEAALAIFVAMVMDVLDGRVARLTKTTTLFGKEFDSLADVVSFGVAPGLLLYSYAFKDLGRIGWLAAFLFVICGALRLARFNVMTISQDRRFFIGLPIPGAAGAVASWVLLFGDPDFDRWQVVGMALATYLLAFLMVSNTRYYSFKELDFARQRPFGVILLIVLGVLIIASYPHFFAFLLFGTYGLSGPARHVILILRRKESIPTPEAKSGGEA